MRATAPIFSQFSAASKPDDYLIRARQFQTAATSLVGYVNGQINWPSYALLFHACELTLKAYCLQYAPGVPLPKHSLKKLYEIAEQHGLVLPANITQALDVLEDMHAQHWARYPDNRTGPILDVSALACDVGEVLMNAVSASFQSRSNP
jgi:hypothetical protein